MERITVSHSPVMALSNTLYWSPLALPEAGAASLSPAAPLGLSVFCYRVTVKDSVMDQCGFNLFIVSVLC